jgi:sucrose-6F-phosphate phosphohydrolase
MKNQFNPQSDIAPSVLATDLDGTLIPLPDSPDNLADLERLKKALAKAKTKTKLVFATGRHFESAMQAIKQYSLPTPEWIVCDVGSAIYKYVGEHGSGDFEVFSIYEAHLEENSGGVDRAAIENTLFTIEGLEMQPPDHQQRFKISYRTTADLVNQIVDDANGRLEQAGLPYHCVGSLDPFMNCGLLDVMPLGVSKAYALLWLSTHADFRPDEVIYSGDSGNDLAALESGFRAIIVANGSEGLEAKVKASLNERGLSDRLFVAKSTATSGVLEGCRHFGLLE